METSDAFAGGGGASLPGEATRALLMARRARAPIYCAMVQVAVVSIAIPAAMRLPLLAGLGGLLFASLWAALRSIERGVAAFRRWSHCVYLVSLVALAYAVLGLHLSGALTVYSTATILLGSAYLLGTGPALFWAMPCAALVAADAFTVSGPDLPVPPLVSFVVRFVTLGTILAFAVSFRWAHDQQAALLEYRATTDPLTGLANRHEFEHALAGALARATRFGRRGAVVFIDMDGMKSINDTLGHEVGDALLKEIAARIRSQTREVDTPARLGGDEFVVLMSEFDDAKGAEILGRKLSAVLAQPWTSEGRRIEPLASIGIAEFPELSGDPRELLRLADAAMYAAKRSEATRICAYRRSGIEEIA